MAKGVLGNDPFQRGAANRSPASLPVLEAEPRLGSQPLQSPKAVVARKVKGPSSRRAPKRKAVRPTAEAAPEATVAPAPAAAAVSVTRQSEVASEVGDSAHNLDVEPLPPVAPFSERALGALGIARDLLRGAATSEGLSKLSAALQASWHAIISGLGASASLSVDAYGKDENLVREMAPITDFLYERYWRVTVENARAIPRGPVIIVANHAGAMPLDGPVLQQALLRERPDLLESRWLVEDQIFYAPFIGTLLNRLGAVRACPENALRLLSEKRPVLVFPEGIQGISKPFRERYQLKRFGRGGFVKIALRAGVPIIPVAIVGGEESLPLLTKLPGRAFGLPYLPVTPLGPLPLPVKWSIRVGDPLDLSKYSAASAEDVGVVQDLTESTRHSIQSMLGALIKDRRSIFGG